VIFALVVDARVIERPGQVPQAGVFALEYGITDLDGLQPAPFRFAA